MYDLTYRPRRLRTSPEMRDLVRETTLDTTDLIYPLFIVPGEGIKKEIDTLPGQYHLSVDEAVKVAQEAYDLGIRGVEIFGIPTYKDEQGSSAWDMEQPVQQAIKAIREAVPNLLVIADVCLCQYTSTGHCGMIDDHEILNDETLPLLCKVAVSHVYSDSLLTLGTKAIGENGQIHSVFIFILRLLFEYFKLIGQNTLAIIKQATNKGTLSVIYTTGSDKS